MSEKRVVVTGRQSGKTAQLLQAAYDENATIRQQLQKAEARLEVARMAEEAWEKTMMEVIGEDGPASVADAIRKLQDQAAQAPTTPSARWREDGEPDPHGDLYDCERAKLCKGDMTDDELANEVYLKPDIGNLTAAKERIRWLSRIVERLRAQAPASGEVEPVAWTLKWPESNSVNAPTTFSTEDRAKRYAEGCQDMGVRVVPLFTHPPASQVPEALTYRGVLNNTKLHNNRWTPHGIQRYVDGWNDLRHALLTTPGDADTGGSWVRCSERLPARDQPYQCWYSPDGVGVTLISASGVRDMFGTGNVPDAWWKPTGLKRPTPPSDREKM